MSKPKKIDEKVRSRNNSTIWASTGLIVIGLIILQDYTSTGISDIPIFISIIAFSLAFPLLAGAIVHLKLVNDDGYYDSVYDDEYGGIDLIFLLGSICAFIGIVTAFWHVSWIAGVLFLTVSIITLFIIASPVLSTEEIERLEREEAEKERALE